MLAALALLMMLGVSCDPSGQGAPPPQGDIEVRMVVDDPGHLLVDGYDCGDGVGTIAIAGPSVTTTCDGDCGIAFAESLSHLITIDA